MRYGRAKQARKTLQFFERRVGLRQPYHVLLDGTFVVAFTKHGLPLRERVEKLLQANKAIVFVTTESVLKELETLAENSKNAEQKAVLQQTRQWMQQNCSKRLDTAPQVSLDWATAMSKDQLNELSPAGKDLVAVLTASNVMETESTSTTGTPPVCVASQDEVLLHLARQSGKVPVIRLARRSVLLLEHPSQAAQNAEQQAERDKWTVRGSVPEQERMLVDLVKKKERQQQRQRSFPPNPHERKKRKAKAPNPLSCKKKKGDKKT